MPMPLLSYHRSFPLISSHRLLYPKYSARKYHIIIYIEIFARRNFFQQFVLPRYVIIDPRTTSWSGVPHTVGEIKFGEIKFCHNTKYEPLAKFLASENFVIHGIEHAVMTQTSKFSSLISQPLTPFLQV